MPIECGVLTYFLLSLFVLMGIVVGVFARKILSKEE